MAVENDLVLIYFEEKPLVFARIEEIVPDHKVGWYQVKLLILQLPLLVATWILRDAYINGTPFTMDGKNIRMEKIVCPDVVLETDEKPDTDSPGKAAKKPRRTGSKTGTVISLESLRKKSAS